METKFTLSVDRVLKAPVEAAWAAFATSEGFANVYEGITVSGDWRVGGTVVWSGEWEGKAFRDEGHVTVYDRPRVFEYTYWTSFWGKEPTPETIQTIRNTFEPVAGGTKVTITQNNIATAESRDHSAKNWGDILDRVAARLATAG